MDVVEPSKSHVHQGNSIVFGGALESFRLGSPRKPLRIGLGKASSVSLRSFCHAPNGHDSLKKASRPAGRLTRQTLPFLAGILKVPPRELESLSLSWKLAVSCSLSWRPCSNRQQWRRYRLEPLWVTFAAAADTGSPPPNAPSGSRHCLPGRARIFGPSSAPASECTRIPLESA